MDFDTQHLSRLIIHFLIFIALIARNHAAVVNVKSKGAKGDGKTDDGPAIMKAWKEACGGPPPSSVLIPAGTYMAFPPIDLTGPCKGPIEIKATGATVKAPPELEKFKTTTWISIKKVDKLTMTGGTYDGQGKQTWKKNLCPNGGPGKCPLPVNMRFKRVTNSLLKDVTCSNSKFFHMVLSRCDNTKLDHVTINAPANSVNTDGIQIGRVSGLNITNSIMKTNDDCISIGDGSKNIHIKNITCGPGDGVGIGSLGKNPNEEPIKGIWVKNITMTGTEHGIRIKTWPASLPLSVSDVHYEDFIMNNVSFPIFIDQEYCPMNNCPKGSPSKVKLSNISFRKIKGTSATKVAVKLACSSCEKVKLADINLTYKGNGGPATSECANVKPKVVGKVIPPACPAAKHIYNTTL